MHFFYLSLFDYDHPAQIIRCTFTMVRYQQSIYGPTYDFYNSFTAATFSKFFIYLQYPIK